MCASRSSSRRVPCERVRRRVGRVPLGDHVVIRHVGRRVAGRNEVGLLRIARSALRVHGVEQSVARELGVKGEADESALETVVDRHRKRRGHVGVDARRVAPVEQVQKAARVVGEAAAVRQIAHEADARPAGGRHVLIERAQAAGIRQPHEIANLARRVRVFRSAREAGCW